MYQSKIDANITIKRYKNHYSYLRRYNNNIVEYSVKCRSYGT